MSTYDDRQKRYYRKNKIKIIQKAKDRAERLYPERLFRMFGLLPGDYEKLLIKSGNRCEICGASPIKRRLAVDHCHVTRKVRGLLCAPCNASISHIDNRQGWVKKAMDYLSWPGIKTTHSLFQEVAAKSLEDTQ